MPSQFRKRGLRVVVDTTETAEFDFASAQISAAQQEEIATNLKAVPVSQRDKLFGYVRIREILPGWQVAFIIAPDGDELVVLVIGLDTVEGMETQLELLMRAGLSGLPGPIQTMLEGRSARRKR